MISRLKISSAVILLNHGLRFSLQLAQSSFDLILDLVLSACLNLVKDVQELFKFLLIALR